MIRWALSHIFTFAVRVVLTFLACVTIQRLIQAEGYRCELRTLLGIAAIVVVIMYAWMTLFSWRGDNDG